MFTSIAQRRRRNFGAGARGAMDGREPRRQTIHQRR